MTIKILLADDHSLVADGLRLILETQPDFDVVGVARTGREAIQLTGKLKPDVLLMDVGMPELNGIDAAELITLDHPAVAVVMLSMYASQDYVLRAFRVGARGYVLKESAGQEVVEAVRISHRGERFLSPRLQDLVLQGRLDLDADASLNPLDRLSVREREVLQLVAEGQTSAEIAQAISLSPKTVETYRSRIMTKLGVDDVPSLIKLCIQCGLINLDS
jgi:DNA-binding NarL/FixJ family response regulator